MRTDSEVFRFGRFEFHPERRRLFRGGERVAIPESQLNLVGVFVTHPGEIVSVDALADAGWHGEAVTNNNVAQAVSRLRKSLGVLDDGLPLIENVARRGYRFVAPVVREQTSRPIVEIDSLLAPYTAFVRG